MRRSQIVLTGVAVAGAAVVGSAFTAGNNMPTTSGLVAGYGEVTVSGATVTDIDYTPASDNTKVASVTFTTTTDVSSQTSTLTLKMGANPIHAAYSCTESAYTTSMTLTCATTDEPAFTAFDTVGLTVVD